MIYSLAYLKNCTTEKAYHLKSYKSGQTLPKIKEAIYDICDVSPDLWEFKIFTGGGIAGIFPGLGEFTDSIKFRFEDLKNDHEDIYNILVDIL